MLHVQRIEAKIKLEEGKLVEKWVELILRIAICIN